MCQEVSVELYALTCILFVVETVERVSGLNINHLPAVNTLITQCTHVVLVNPFKLRSLPWGAKPHEVA